jgi:sec-independent protein translocase protein TatC
MKPGDRKPGERIARREQQSLTSSERAKLGPPQGKRPEPSESEEEKLRREMEEVENFRMPLMDHLIELKNRLLKALAALVVGVLVSLFFSSELVEFIGRPYREAGGGLAMVHSPFEGIFVILRISVLGGVMFAMPVISWQIWQFVAPGLYATERKIVAPLSISSTTLFMLGAGFCYYGVFPYAFPFLLNVIDLEMGNISVDGYLSAVTRMMLAFGVCFQGPVVSLFLSRIGLIDHLDMWRSFCYAVVVIFVLAALITPPDPLTQSLLAIPLILLYVLSTGIAWVFTTKVRDDEDEAAS